MNNKRISAHMLESSFFTFIALSTMGIIYYLFYFDPVNFSLLITEDYWGEYGTAVCYGLTGIILVMLSLRKGPRFRKMMWALIGVFALIIAGEEMSWGQRIFGFSTPDNLREINFQQEFNVHNIESLRFIFKWQWTIAALLITVWLVVSSMIIIFSRRIEEKFIMTGLPLIPIKLIPMFLLVPYFFIFSSIVKSDEIGELLLGVAVFLWAFDLFLSYGLLKRPVGLSSIGLVLGTLFCVAFISAALSHAHVSFRSDTNIAWRMNMMAKRDYPLSGMFNQAQHLYKYIYAHPRYIRSDTEINHARMLLDHGKSLQEKSGMQNEASQVFLQVVELLKTKEPLNDQDSERLKLLGMASESLGQVNQIDVTSE